MTKFVRILAATILFAFVLPPVTSGTDDAHAQRRSKKSSKAAKKQKRINRHLFTARYLVVYERDYKAAVREYNKVLRIDKKHKNAALGVADLYVRLGQPKKARSVLSKMSRRQQSSAEVWRALGDIELALGSREKALAAFRSAIKARPADEVARYRVFKILETKYRGGDKAIAPELKRESLAFLRYSRRRHGTAYHDVERTLVELSGDKVDVVVYDANAAYKAAFLERRMGNINAMMDKARKGYQQCIKLQPTNERCHLGLGRVFASVKSGKNYDRNKAIAQFSLAPKLPEAHVEIAQLLRLDDEIDNAKKALERALTLKRNYQPALVEMAVLQKIGGDEDKAVATLEKAYAVNRFTSAAERALNELAKIQPEHRLVQRGLMWGKVEGDLFSSDRFNGAVKLIEQRFGGVDADAKEQPALERALSKILAAADVDSRFRMKVKVLDTKIVNAMALPNGNLYFTRGFLDYLKKTWPDRKVDDKNDVLGHVMAHEVAHVLRGHTMQSTLFRTAVRDASSRISPQVLTHVTRLQEVEADRVGIVLASLAGYHPRGGIEFMEKRGGEEEIPTHLDHPTYEERVDYLEEYWSNDVRYAYLSFQLGNGELAKGDLLRGTDPSAAGRHYRKALTHYRRFQTKLRPTKAVLSNIGSTYARLGVLELAAKDTPLTRWQTPFSVEHKSGLKYKSARRKTRGGGNRAVPRSMKKAISLYKEALKRDPTYSRAHANLAAVYLALGDMTKAKRHLSRAKPGPSIEPGRLATLRGIVWAESKQFSKAGTAFRQAMKHKGTKRAAYYNMARTYELAGMKAKAKKWFKSYVKRYPKGAWTAAARRSLKKL